jgi:opacity protein-like surface antigen
VQKLSLTMMILMMTALLAVPSTAMAQRRVPAADSGAVGGDVGLFLPRDGALTTGPTLEGFYEYYLTPRNSIRVGAGWANPKLDREHSDSLRHIRIAVDTVYNWEGGAVHPFVGAGIGVYFLQAMDNGKALGESESKPGGTLFGGAEFFTSRTMSVKAEARYHLVKDALGLNPDGLALTLGVKKYF